MFNVYAINFIGNRYTGSFIWDCLICYFSCCWLLTLHHSFFSFILSAFETWFGYQNIVRLFLWLCSVCFSSIIIQYFDGNSTTILRVLSRLPVLYTFHIHICCYLLHSFILFGKSEFVQRGKGFKFHSFIRKPWHFHFCLCCSSIFGRMFVFVGKCFQFYLLYFYTYDAWCMNATVCLPLSRCPKVDLETNGMKIHEISSLLFLILVGIFSYKFHIEVVTSIHSAIWNWNHESVYRAPAAKFDQSLHKQYQFRKAVSFDVAF